MRKLSALVFCVLIVSSAAFADNLVIDDPGNIGVGGRPMGMGKAFVGIANDTSAIFMNPAGLAAVDKPQFISMYGTMLGGESVYNLLGGSYSFGEAGTVGLGIVNNSIGDIALVDTSGDTDIISYSRGIFFLSYGRNLDMVMEDLEAGANLKYYYAGYSDGGGSGSGVDLDVGARKKVLPWMRLGAAFRNFLSTGAGGKFTTDGREEAIPGVFTVGLGSKLIGRQAPWTIDQQVLYLATDVDFALEERIPALAHVGVEWWPVRFFALRTGVNHEIEGKSPMGFMTAGAGFRWEGFEFDYGYEGRVDNTAHYFSLGFSGRTDIEEEPEEDWKRRITLKRFKDVPEDHWAREEIEYMATTDVMPGYPDGTYKPDMRLKRGDMIVLMMYAFDIEPTKATEKVFEDVYPSNWAAGYLKKAKDLGVITGYPDGTFRPGKIVTRAEAIALATRLDSISNPESLKEMESADLYNDVPVNHWAANNVSHAKNKKMLTYVMGKYFEPDKRVNRAETAVILYKTDHAQETLERIKNQYEIVDTQ